MASAHSSVNLVFIHGWGSDSKIFQPWVDQLSQRFDGKITCLDLAGFGANQNQSWPADMDAYCTSLLDDLPEKAVYLGWSMGGNVALNIAKIAPDRVQGLILLASNPSFVERAGSKQAHWEGMDADTFAQFSQGLAQNSAKTLKRFRALQLQGAESESGESPSTLLRAVNRLQSRVVASDEVLIDSLRWLGEVDSRSNLESVIAPVLSIFGECDALVPVKVAKNAVFTQFNRQVDVIEKSSHLPFLSHPNALTDRVLGFLNRFESSDKNGFAASKKAVADSFSRAASTYDGAAQLQRDVCDLALSRIPNLGVNASLDGLTILDLGCGTGYGTQQLAQRRAKVIGLDLALGMVEYARDKLAIDSSAWLAGDAEALPLADNSVDLVFSSLAIQWCANEDTLMQELYRILKPSGHFVFSTLGPETLCELKQAWANVDGYVHVNRFTPLAQMQKSAEQAGFTEAEPWLQQPYIEYFSQVKEITRELKHIGAHNVTSGRPKGLTGRKKIAAMIAGYEAQRLEDGRLPATYDVLYGVLQKLAKI